MNEIRVDVASGKGRGDENFPVGSRLISPALRPHVHAYYAFARAIDDIVDNAILPPPIMLARLDAMQAALLGGAPPVGSALEGVHLDGAHLDGPHLDGTELDHAELAIAGALRRSLAATGVDPATATDLIVAFRQDAIQHRYQSWDELALYCRYSANPVGRYLLALHGEGAAPVAASDALCSALQVLNHLQDCAADLASLDRCYIPLPWLQEQGLGLDVLRGAGTPAGLRRVFDRMLDGVDRLNREAAGLPARINDRRMRLEAAVIVGLSHRLAHRLRREDPLAGRVRLRRLDIARSLLGAARYGFGRGSRRA